MFFGAVALGALAVALVARRPLGRLLDRRFRAPWVLWLAVALQLTFVPPALSPVLATAPGVGLPPLGALVYLLSLGLLIAFTWLNRRISGVLVIGLGLLLNALVIGGNGGRMPVEPGQLAAIGLLDEFRQMEGSGRWSTYSVMTSDTRLDLLGDRFTVPRPFMEPVILSLGDLVIAAGIVLFFVVIPEAREQRVASSG